MTVADLVAANNIANPNRIYVGQVLQLGGGAAAQAAPAPAPAPAPAAPAASPPAAPSVYVVQTGDTLHQIAVRLGVTIQALAAANNLLNPNLIYAGQQLTVPAPGTVPGGPPGQPGLFIWPVESRNVIQWFHYGHSAIDIVVPVGSTIWAAAGGVVEFAGWNQYGYGNLVVIDHQNGYRTLYAHHDSLLVASGDTVAQGDPIGLSGSTGRSNMPHLHLEIVLDWQRLNPCAYLPGGC
jgi:murein DD-endopeptidase MepM/ murein hydrolase activator NlpD